ncbi:MAG: carboxylating nicotinate-nucleotide diphosphorylase [Candidatus Baldrarchaeia archaeon]
MSRHEYASFLFRKFSEFLEEDVGLGDVTTEVVVPRDARASAIIISKASGVVAGVEEVAEFFIMNGVTVEKSLKSGSEVSPGTVIMEVTGPARNILVCERVALNILMRMSGIATATAEMFRRAKAVNKNVIIAGTRKGVPGFRYFEKKAIMVGGGDPHRLHLDDCILIKDNHIAVAGGVREAIRRARAHASFTKKIEVEVRTLEEALEAAREGADIIMLDNMEPDEVERVINALKKEGLREKVLIEVSGGITPENVTEYARTGVDIISAGYLTHSVRPLDMSLKIIKCW